MSVTEALAPCDCQSCHPLLLRMLLNFESGELEEFPMGKSFMRMDGWHLEALPVHDGWTRLIVFLFGDPHLLEGGQ